MNHSDPGFFEDMYGGAVPAGGRVVVRPMHRLEQGPRTWDNWQVEVQGGEGEVWLRWSLIVHWPEGHRNGAVLLSPDGCWPHCVNEAAALEAGREGVALAWFNRLELAFDAADALRAGPLFDRWQGSRFGALSAWAWGLQRCVDALLLTGLVKPGRIGVVGHSRGGKAALLAGAGDPRIAATIAHNSGTGGAASLQVVGEGSESLAELAARFPHWLGPKMGDEAVRQRCVQTDNLPLLRAIAPRGLCILQASDDAWANPLGSRHAFEQLRPHWAALGAEQRVVYQERTGGHPMSALDWRRAAAFLRQVIEGQAG